MCITIRDSYNQLYSCLLYTSTSEIQMEYFDHPPYSPDLAPPNPCHLFMHLKRCISGFIDVIHDEFKSAMEGWQQTSLKRI